MSELGETRLAVLAEIEASIAKNGWPPSLRELCTLLGISSTSVVRYHLIALEEAGYIERIPGIARGIRVVEGVK